MKGDTGIGGGVCFRLAYTVYIEVDFKAKTSERGGEIGALVKSILYTFTKIQAFATPDMPIVTFHKNGQTYRDEVAPKTNLVVRAGIKAYPYPHLQYQCGMGKCATCATRVLAGAEHLPPPNWKEKKQLGDRLEHGWRLTCQLWVEHDIELQQD